jgi:hypothetical protein
MPKTIRENYPVKVLADRREDEELTLDFWRGKTPEERISAVEFLREQYYVIQGYRTVPRIVKKISLVDPQDARANQ